MAITPGGTDPRFPGYDVVAQATRWDPATARVVLARVELAGGRAGPPHFFTAAEEPTARALCDRLLAQDAAPKVPVFEMIDLRLADGRGDGYRYADMPDDADAWRRSLAGLDVDAAAAARHADGAGQTPPGRATFADLDRRAQLGVLDAVRTSDGDWHGLPAGRTFSLWLRYTCAAFYSHPWAWNEIGFGGPAYPQGYKNLGIGALEPHEVAEEHSHDPVPWADRVEAARARHGGDSPADRS